MVEIGFQILSTFCQLNKNFFAKKEIIKKIFFCQIFLFLIFLSSRNVLLEILSETFSSQNFLFDKMEMSILQRNFCDQ